MYCHTSVGAANNAAMPAPTHSSRVRKSSRGPSIATAETTTTHNSRTWNFVKAAMPVTTPKASSRLSSRCRTHRINSQIISSHSTGSRV
jgi:hypothetical protein